MQGQLVAAARLRRAILLVVVLFTTMSLHATASNSKEIVQFDIEAQDLGNALAEFAVQSGKEILFVEGEITGKLTNAVQGSYEPIDALERLLADTGVQYRVNDFDTILIGNEIRVTTGEPSETEDPGLPEPREPSGLSIVAVDADQADEDSAGVIDEIVVVGIRGSLGRSLVRKRNADHLVDAITAEDIGAFPDQNLAESLQRISGVAIDRKSGEGAFVSVRGLGPQFVMTTVHGRVMASNVAPGSHDGLGNTNTKSRAVGFNAFQSGLVQAVEIHKSPRADHVEGGLGGFIDIEPRRPLDLGKRHVALSLDATRNDLADDTAPGVFALYSDVLSDKLGFMISAQFDNRELRSDFIGGSYLGDPRTTTVNGVEMTGYYPALLNSQLHLIDRDRLNISSSLQWQPSDNVDVTFDVLYTDNSSDEARHLRSFRISQGHPRITDAAVINDNGTGIFTMVSTSGAGAFIEHATEQVDTENFNYGVNVIWQASDRLTVNFDVSLSETDSPITNRDALMRNTSTQMTYNMFGPGGMPSMTSMDDLTDVTHWEVVKQSIQKHLVDDRQFQTRVDLNYEFDDGWLDALQVGARIYRQERGDTSRYLNSRAFIRDPVSEHGGVVPFPESDFLSGLGVLFQPGIPNPNFDALQQTFITRPDDIRNGGGFNTGTEKSLSGFTQQGQFNEDINHEDDGDAIYAMVTFSGEVGSIPYSGNLGVRYVDNSTGSIGEQSEPIGVDFSDPSSPEVIVSVPEFLDIGHSYSEVLPSLNLKFDLRDDLVGRVSVAKVMSRPRFLDLSPRQNVQARPRTMRGGNGELDPTTAVQVDLALEWYFADYSIASIGVFHKDIDAFVQPEVTPTPFPGVIDPETNQPLVLTAFRPLNTGDSELTGVELAFQATFSNLPEPFNGLGVIANWTHIDSGSDFENEKTMASYSIPGLSENTINFTVFYEKGPWSARVSYNSRDEFLDDINGGFSGHPYFVEDYDQIDASVGFILNDNLSFALEGINLTEEDVYYFNWLATAEGDYRVNAIHTGRRFQFGIRYKM